MIQINLTPTPPKFGGHLTAAGYLAFFALYVYQDAKDPGFAAFLVLITAMEIILAILYVSSPFTKQSAEKEPSK